MVEIEGFEAEELDRCPLCGGEAKHLFDAHAVRNLVPLTVWECQVCDVSFHNPMMTEKGMKDYYASGHYIRDMIELRNERGTFGERSRALRLIGMAIYLGNVEQPKRALDVGCSNGYLLERVKDWSYGVETVGYDSYVNPDALCEVITDKDKITGTFDFISCIHTLEHVRYPIREMEWMYGMLEKDGLFILEVPIGNELLVEHPYMMTAKTVKYLLKHVGIERYLSITAQGLGSFIVYGIK